MLLPQGGEAASAAGSVLTEPWVVQTVARLLRPGARLQISSSMPIRDLDFFSRPHAEPLAVPLPPAANRGASGIDGNISTAAGLCHGTGEPSTLIIGDVSSLHDINSLQQISGPNAPPLTVVVVNNGGGGIFSFLPIAQHKELMDPFFNEPHDLDFTAACAAFGIDHMVCKTAEEFEAAYLGSQRKGAKGARLIEASVSLSREDNVALHKAAGQAVAARATAELLSQVQLGWIFMAGAQDQAPSSKATIVLLHGWLGEKADWAEVTRCLTAAGHDVLAVDLPGHGAADVGAGHSADPWEAAALFSIPAAAEALAELLGRLRIERALLAGYSLGGRVAMAFTEKYPARALGVVALSANPGLKSPVERRQRWLDDSALAQRLLAAALPGAEGLKAFLARWYAAPLWGGLAERRPEAYASMLARRLRTHPRLAAHSLLGMSLAQQGNLWPAKAAEGSLGPHLWYAYGELDKKFGAIGKELQRVVDGPGRVTALPDAGHALVEECPAQVARLLADIAGGLQSHAVPAPAASPPDGGVRLTGTSSRPFQIALKAPLLLSRGDPMPRREGHLLVFTGSSAGTEGPVHAGLGEVCPLPMFHRETLAEAQTQLDAVLCAWAANPPVLPPALARLDGRMRQWLEQHCPMGGALLPSVKAGLEMAILHLLGRCAGDPHLGAAAARARGNSVVSEVGVNALVAREEDLDGPSDGASVVKVKVGKDPLEDALRTNRLAEALEGRKGPDARLRLDANQAWTVDEAAAFVGALSNQAVALTEYLEE